MMKSRRRMRVAACLLVLVLVLSAMAPFASAAGSNSLAVDKDRFFANVLYFMNGSGRLLDNGGVLLSFDDGEPSVTLAVSKTIPNNVNSIRVVINNLSLADKMEAVYMARYENTDTNFTRTVECEIVKGHGAQEYLIPIGEGVEVSSLRLGFKGAAHGEIEILSIGFVSHYADGREYCGELIKTEYDQTNKSALIQGSVSWDCVSNNPGTKIAVYKLSEDQTIDELTETHSYIAYSDISLNFSIKIDVKKSADAISQYALAVLTESGEILPVAPEFYLNVKKLNTVIEKSDGFKGMETNLYGGAIDGNSEIAYVDVNLGRLFGNEENGFQYIHDGVEYYVDSEYVTGLDAIIKAYEMVGTDVYLRLLIDESFAGSISGDARYYAVNVYDDEILNKFAVYTEYVVGRYASVSKSNVKGIVYGRSLDLYKENNYSRIPLSLDEYSRRLAKISAIVRNILDKYASGLEFIIPLSDNPFGTSVIVADPEALGCYSVDLLASSFLEYANDFGVDLSGIRFMLESKCAPVGKQDANVYAAIENCRAFGEMLASFKERFALVSVEFAYCWYASTENVANNYAYNYNVAACTEGVSSFVVSLVDLGEGERSALNAIGTAYKFADTDKSTLVNGGALEKLGINSWSDLIDGFDENKLIRQNLARIELKTAIPSAIIGSYNMWDFAKGASAYGWQELSSEKVSVGAVEGGVDRAFTITMSKEIADSIGSSYSSAVYHHDNLMKVTGISGLSFEIFVPKGDQEKIYEVIITITSEDSVTEFSGVVFSGSEAMLYADIQKIDVVKSIEISARDLSATDESFKLYVRNIAIHSNEYGDTALEKLVVSGSITDSGARSDVESEELAETIVVAVIVVSLMIIWGVWLFYKASKAI